MLKNLFLPDTEEILIRIHTRLKSPVSDLLSGHKRAMSQVSRSQLSEIGNFPYNLTAAFITAQVSLLFKTVWYGNKNRPIDTLADTILYAYSPYPQTTVVWQDPLCENTTLPLVAIKYQVRNSDYEPIPLNEYFATAFVMVHPLTPRLWKKLSRYGLHPTSIVDTHLWGDNKTQQTEDDYYEIALGLPKNCDIFGNYPANILFLLDSETDETLPNYFNPALLRFKDILAFNNGRYSSSSTKNKASRFTLDCWGNINTNGKDVIPFSPIVARCRTNADVRDMLAFLTQGMFYTKII